MEMTNKQGFPGMKIGIICIGDELLKGATLNTNLAFLGQSLLSEGMMAELSLEDALCYLRREALRLPDNTPRGFVLVTYHGHPLGFVKNLGDRANNLYPKPWAIRHL